MRDPPPPVRTAPGRAVIIRRLKILYFWQAIGPSSWGRYSSAFYASVALSPGQIGLITGTMPLIRGLAMPCWGLVADRLRAKKRTALVTQACSALTLVLLAVPDVAVDHDGSKGRFDVIWAVSAASAVFSSSGVLDAYAISALGDAEKARFGEIRLYTTISWGLANLVMGLVADATGDLTFNILFFVGCTFVTVAILAVLIPEQQQQQPHEEESSRVASVETDEGGTTGASNGRRDDDDDANASVTERGGGNDDEALREGKPRATARRSRRHALAMGLFVVELVVIGAGMGLVERLLFVYIIDVLDGSYSLCGLTVVATVLFEIPIFADAKRILRVLGHETCFVLALACYVPRVVGYTLVTRRTKYWIIPIELAHGVTFGFMFAAAVDKAAELAPPGRTATYQTVQNAVRGCLGAGLGAALGGLYWQRGCARRGRRPTCRAGAVALWRLMGAVFSVVLVVHLVLLACGVFRESSSDERRRKRRRRPSGRRSEEGSLAAPLLPDDDDAELETLRGSEDGAARRTSTTEEESRAPPVLISARSSTSSPGNSDDDDDFAAPVLRSGSIVPFDHAAVRPGPGPGPGPGPPVGLPDARGPGGGASAGASDDDPRAGILSPPHAVRQYQPLV